MRVQSNVPSPSAWEPHYLSRQAQLARSLRSLFYSPVATCNLLCGNAPSSYPHRWHAGRRIKGAFINDQAIFDGNCSVVRRRYGGLGLARIANRAAAEPIRPDSGGAKKTSMSTTTTTTTTTTTNTTTTPTTLPAASTTTAIDIGVTATMFGPTIGRVLAASSLVQSGIARSQPIHLQQDPGLCPPAGASPHGLVDLSRRSYMDDQTPNGFGKLIISRSVFSVAHPMLSLSQGSGKSPGPLRSGLFSHSTLVD